MTMPTPAESYLIYGSTHNVWCPGCRSTDRVEALVYELTHDGVAPADETFSYCPRCSLTQPPAQPG
jgi:hypothetical protein